ncbi:hypothetical protein ACFONG_19400 [Uliginosibacterium paludis]|uniref:Uncharacterized protein n=1 Tax=Uliginosibacterium paludis TaxID=1615952 RepID=A0ABV2CUC4_9RHOO
MATYVPFLSIEDEDDLVVSFGLGAQAQTSLTLLRSPQLEFALHEEDRGVSVGGESENGERELLKAITWGRNTVEILSTIRRYALNVSAVDPIEIQEAKRVLRKMNFDNSFEVKDV